MKFSELAKQFHRKAPLTVAAQRDGVEKEEQYGGFPLKPSRKRTPEEDAEYETAYANLNTALKSGNKEETAKAEKSYSAARKKALYSKDCGSTPDPDLIPVNDEEKKKEPEKENETLSKWFEREKKKPQPKDGLPEKSQPGGKGDHPEQKKEFRQERQQERAENRAERRSERVKPKDELPRKKGEPKEGEGSLAWLRKPSKKAAKEYEKEGKEMEQRLHS